MASLHVIGLTLLLAVVALVAADDKWIVFTDLEPDDAWMVLVLARAGIVPTAMVVGAGPQMQMKVARAHHWIRTFFPEQVASSIEIVRGDVDGSDSVFAAEGVAEGLGTTDYINIDEYGVADERVPALIKNARQHDNVRIISAKVMSELFRIWRSDNSIFSNVDAYSYLGFNVRSLYEIAASDEVATFVNTAFKTHTLFETYSVLGKTNSCGKGTAPGFWDEFDCQCSQLSPQLNLIRGLMFDWNKSIRDKCLLKFQRVAGDELGASQDAQETLKTYLINGEFDKADDIVQKFVDRSIHDVDAKVAKLLRHAKVVTSVVRGGLDSQFVFADPLVALYVGNYFPSHAEIRPVRFVVGTAGYSRFEPRAKADPRSTAFTIDLGEKHSEDDTSSLKIVTDALQNLL